MIMTQETIDALIAAVAVGLIYGLGAVLARVVFSTPRMTVLVGAGTVPARSALSVDYSGLHRKPGRGKRGHSGAHRA